MSLPGPRRALLALLAVAAAARLALVLGGGQRFFPDENRYLRCFILLRHLERGNVGAATDFVLQNADHTGFMAVGMIPALPQRAALFALGMAPERSAIDATAWLPALFFASASLASIALVGAIARRSGACERESFLAAFLMACSSVMFYYSRHFLPYDAALALALWALWLGLSEAPGFARSLLLGLVAGAAFLTYNGYWLVSLAAIAVHAVHRSSARGLASRAVAAGLGFAILPAALTALSVARDRGVFVRRMMRFSRLASTQADFSEGWSLPWAYLWHAEHGLLLVFAAGALGVLALAARRCESARKRGLLFLAVAAGMYAAMVLFSTGLERIGAFGRQARQLVPPLCLATASAGAPLLASARFTRLWPALGLAAAIQAAFNWSTPLAQRFPRDVARELEARYGALGRDTTVSVAESPEETPLPDARYVLLNARDLHPIYGPKPPPAGRLLFRTPHPQAYLPFQYEGFLPVERYVLRSSDISIRLVDTRPD